MYNPIYKSEENTYKYVKCLAHIKNQNTKAMEFNGFF